MGKPNPNVYTLYTDYMANFYYKTAALGGIDTEQLAHLLQAVMQYLPQGIFIANADLELLAINQQFAKLFGYATESVLADTPDFTQLASFSTLYQDLLLPHQSRLKNLEPVDSYPSVVTVTGDELALHLQIFPYHASMADTVLPPFYFGLVTDITPQISTKIALQQALYFDKLTGLKNRDAIDTALTQLPSVNHLNKTSVVVTIHIDRLYTFNQSIGREATDNLIKSFVARVKTLEVTGCSIHTFSRVSGNDFCLLLQVDDLVYAYDYLDKLSQAFELPFVIAGQKIYLRLSIGVAYLSEETKNVSALLTQAETAMQKARLSGGDSTVWYKDIKQMSDLFDKIHLESALTQGLTRHEFVPFYQPKLSFSQDDSYLFEALVRWQHPELGLLSPQEFIDTLLDAHLDQKLFESIVQAVIADITHWQTQGFHVEVSINADVQQLVNPDFLPFMQGIVTRQPDITQCIEIEITEINRIVDERTTKTTLQQLRDWDFRIALDDFGTGFASLSYLSNYPFDVVKIDRSFITDIMQNAKKQQIVKRMIDLAHDLDMHVYAEGVEDFSQHQFLAMVGCDGTQGFLYGKPMSREATHHWLQMQVSSRLD